MSTTLALEALAPEVSVARCGVRVLGLRREDRSQPYGVDMPAGDHDRGGAALRSGARALAFGAHKRDDYIRRRGSVRP